MPFCDVVGLFDYWQQFPPMHILLRGYVGYDAPEPAIAEATQETAEALRILGANRKRKLKRAPAYIREAAERMKKKANG